MKSNTRKRLILLRSELTNEEISALSKKIQTRLFRLPEYQKARSVLFYFSFGSEVITENMIVESLKQKILLLPRTIIKDKTIQSCEVKDLKNDLQEGFGGIIEPKKKCKVYAPQEIDLIIVPGIAFGEKGERLGYGSGFYDRFLKNCTGTFVGLCFEIQITDKIIEENHDIRMHKIVTEKRVIDCKI